MRPKSRRTVSNEHGRMYKKIFVAQFRICAGISVQGLEKIAKSHLIYALV